MQSKAVSLAKRTQILELDIVARLQGNPGRARVLTVKQLALDVAAKDLKQEECDEY